MKRHFYKFVFFRLLGWKIEGKMDPEILKSVLMIVPHTSWRDFFIGLLARAIIGLEMHYVAKAEFFRFPFGAWFRWMGGAPLDRKGGQQKVDEIVRIFQQRDVFRMAIAPEGTRKKVTELKSGFYWIALRAKVPIIPIAFDYGKKTVRLHEPFFPSGDYQRDLTLLAGNFTGVNGYIPEFSFGFSPEL